MDDMPDDDSDPSFRNVFDTSKSRVEYARSRDTNRVTITIKDPGGISEMRMYLVLVLEIEKLERRLGISDMRDEKH